MVHPYGPVSCPACMQRAAHIYPRAPREDPGVLHFILCRILCCSRMSSSARKMHTMLLCTPALCLTFLSVLSWQCCCTDKGCPQSLLHSRGVLLLPTNAGLGTFLCSLAACALPVLKTKTHQACQVPYRLIPQCCPALGLAPCVALLLT